MIENIAWSIDAIATFGVPMAAAFCAVRRMEWKRTLFTTTIASVAYGLISSFTIDYLIPDYDRSLQGLTFGSSCSAILGLTIGGIAVGLSKLARASKTVTS